MNPWHLAAAAVGLGTMLCFAAAIPLYFRRGPVTPGKRVLLVALVLCGAAQAVALVRAADVPAEWRASGLALFALAHAIFWCAVAAHGRERPREAFSYDRPGRLVRTGPYRWVRHPFYLAYTVAWTAGAVATAAPELIPTVLVMFVMYRSAAAAEEATFLASGLADEYRAYQRRTGMFLPRVCVRPSKSEVVGLKSDAS